MSFGADGNRSAGFDRVAACAAVSLNAPLAAVSIVERETVRLVGSFGFDVREIARRGSFCDAVARLGAPLQIADAAADFRFQGHELVRNMGIRAYSGAPVASDGMVVGAVCVFSRHAGAFHRAALTDLAALAHMLELLRDRSVMAEPPPAPIDAWLGVRTLDPRRDRLPPRAGLVILSVAKGSPAEQVGFRATDILYAVDDCALRERADLLAALSDREPGSAARVTFQRAGVWMERWVPMTSRRETTIRPTQA